MDKVVYLPQGTGTALDNLNELLFNGWSIVEIHTTDACCFVWIKKDKDEK
ncbi:MAG: hypothetical protein FWH14_06075 [Oscillospiraceae bacterium]|nr:hypothetical protein [Oscillospiraceae bacterium]